MAVRKGLVAAWCLTCLLSFGGGVLVGLFGKVSVTSDQTRFKAHCVSVLDGDTISVTWALGTNRLRMVGLDALEVHDGKKLKEQAAMLGIRPGILEIMAKNSRNELANLVMGRDVNLEFPEGANSRDSFGRLLSYVDRDGVDVGAWMVEQGWAYPRKEKHPRMEAYAALHREAQVNGRGFFAWKDEKSGE
jgi:endonuclease YncB( thermonuclease family)